MAKYIKQDSENGYIEDSAEIQALKFNNVRHSVLGCMMGDFDENGLYYVKPEISKELIAMPKYIVDTMDNIEICHSVVKLDKQISYMVVFEGDKATLYLIEKMSYEANFSLNSGSWSNVNEYVLDQVQTSGEINRQMIYLKWNIQSFPGNIIDIFNCDPEILEKYFNIVNRFKYNLKANTILLEKQEELEEIEAEYTLDVFAILNDYPELKAAIEKQLQETLTEKKDFFKLDKPNFSKTLNEALEKAIEDNIQVLSESEQEKFNEEKHGALVKANIKRYDIIELNKEKFNDKEQANSVLQVNAGDVKFESLQELAEKFVKAQKQAEEKLQAKAEEICEQAYGESTLKVVQVVEKIVTKETVQNLVSAATAEKIKQKQEQAKSDKVENKATNNAAPQAASEQKKDSKAKAPAKKPAAKKAAAKGGAKPKSDGGGKKPAAKKPSLDAVKKALKEAQDAAKLAEKYAKEAESAISHKLAAEYAEKAEKAAKLAEAAYEKAKKAAGKDSAAAKLVKDAKTASDNAVKSASRAKNIAEIKKKKAKSTGVGSLVGGAVERKENSIEKNPRQTSVPRTSSINVSLMGGSKFSKQTTVAYGKTEIAQHAVVIASGKIADVNLSNKPQVNADLNNNLGV